MRFSLRIPARAHAGAQPPRPQRRWLGRRASTRGQTLVEVGLILPIFVLALTAIIEFGYWAAVDAAVHTASREGARYGSTVDDPDGAGSGKPNYLNCSEIRAHVRDRTGPLITLANSDITIGYDTNGAPGAELTCDASPLDTDIDRWDRVEVQITYVYEPVTPILRAMIGNTTMVSIDRRSIVKCEAC